MKEQQRFGAILAGGSGERFWPLSRRARPKQLLTLPGAHRSLLGEAVERATPLFGTDHTLVLTGPHLVEGVQETCPELPTANVVAEPMPRNTAGALSYLAAWLLAEGNDPASTTVAVMTSDHKIGPIDAFVATASKALSIAEDQPAMVTIGIRPTRPETGFGYIETLDEVETGVFSVKRFHEKPSLDLAQNYVTDGRFLWNSGMFFYRLSTFLQELERAAPAQADAISAMAGHLREGRTEELHRVFSALPSISIDYLLMERAQRVAVVEAAFSWDDVGTWDAFARNLDKDQRGNATHGEVALVRSADCLVYNASETHTVALLGVYDLLVVCTDDALLICDQEQAQNVREVVKLLREQGSDRL